MRREDVGGNEEWYCSNRRRRDASHTSALSLSLLSVRSASLEAMSLRSLDHVAQPGYAPSVSRSVRNGYGAAASRAQLYCCCCLCSLLSTAASTGTRGNALDPPQRSGCGPRESWPTNNSPSALTTSGFHAQKTEKASCNASRRQAFTSRKSKEFWSGPQI